MKTPHRPPQTIDGARTRNSCNGNSTTRPGLVETAYTDWEDYRRHLEAEEALELMDRTEELESIRRRAWSRARTAVGHIEGVAAALSAHGLDQSARSLLAAAGNINAVLQQYA